MGMYCKTPVTETVKVEPCLLTFWQNPCWLYQMPDFTTQLHSDILPEYHRTQESGAVQQCPTKQKSYLVKWICGIYGSPLLPCYITLKPPKLWVVDHPQRPVLMPPLPQSLDHNNNSSRFTTQRSPPPESRGFQSNFWSISEHPNQTASNLSVKNLFVFA